MSLSVNVMFGANCREAVTFYSKVFNQEVPAFLTYREVDTSFDPNVQVSENGKNLVMSASLNIANTYFTFNDIPENFEFIRGNSYGIAISFDDKKMAEEMFKSLCKNGQVFVPFAEIPEQGYYGMLADQYKIMWTIKTK